MAENFGYDLDGNLTSDGRWTYTWDAENRLISMTANTTSWPAEFAQVRLRREGPADSQAGLAEQDLVNNPTNDVKFLYDGWNLMAELDANNSNAKVRTYAWGTDLSGSMQGAGGVGGLLEVVYYGTLTTNCFVAYDGNGNVAALVNANDGKPVCQYQYGPFGENIRSSGPMAKFNPIRFSTKYQDEESDLVYYGYRFYNESIGISINRDPLGDEGFRLFHIRKFPKDGVKHPYVVARNNFENSIDLNGLCDEGYFRAEYAGQGAPIRARSQDSVAIADELEALIYDNRVRRNYSRKRRNRSRSFRIA